MNQLEQAIRGAQPDESFARNISCKVYGVKEGALAVSTFADNYHEIIVYILVDAKNFLIVDAKAQMTRIPYNMCREAEAGLHNLRGLSIYHRGVNREVRRRIPRREGCTHLFEIIEFTLASLFSGMPVAGMKDDKAPSVIKDETPEEHRMRNLENPWLRNTCRSFAVNNSETENDK